MSVIDYLTSAIATLENELKSVLPTYVIEPFLRFPSTAEKFPMGLIVPVRVVPSYEGGLAQEDEYANIEIEIHLITKVPFDYDGTTLLVDLDIVLDKLRTLRFDSSKWRQMQYTPGIEFAYEMIDRAVLQSAVIRLAIEM